jgi:Zn-dependent protease
VFSDPVQFVVNSLYLIPALLIGLIGHEFAHAAVAVARGDQTPRLDGRLSLNPSHHLDPLGTIAILLIGFGWAKPVRINPFRMRGRYDAALVALAGPVTNLLIAFLGRFLGYSILQFIYAPVARFILSLPPFPLGG